MFFVVVIVVVVVVWGVVVCLFCFVFVCSFVTAIVSEQDTHKTKTDCKFSADLAFFEATNNQPVILHEDDEKGDTTYLHSSCSFSQQKCP